MARGAITATRDMPWYVTALSLSQPLHFGDYGGLPLNFVWALLDIVTIVVLVSGLCLWLIKRKIPAEQLFAGTDSPQKILASVAGQAYHAE